MRGRRASALRAASATAGRGLRSISAPGARGHRPPPSSRSTSSRVAVTRRARGPASSGPQEACPERKPDHQAEQDPERGDDVPADACAAPRRRRRRWRPVPPGPATRPPRDPGPRSGDQLRRRSRSDRPGPSPSPWRRWRVPRRRRSPAAARSVRVARVAHACRRRCGGSGPRARRAGPPARRRAFSSPFRARPPPRLFELRDARRALLLPHRRGGVDGGAPGQDEVEERAEAPHVRPVADLARRLLGREEARRPVDLALLDGLPELVADAEVDEVRAPRPDVDEDVVGLQVAVKDPVLAVRGVDALRDGDEHVLDQARGRSPSAEAAATAARGGPSGWRRRRRSG